MHSSSWYQRLRGSAVRRSVSEAVVVVLCGMALITAGLGGVMGVPWSSPEVSPWWHAPPLALAGLVMLGKRHRPIGTLLAAMPMVAVDAWLGGSLGMVLVLIDLIYSAALRGGSAAVRRLGLTIGAFTVGSTAGVFLASGDVAFTALVFIQFFALLCTPLWWGTSVRQQTQLAKLASARAEDLQRLTELREAEAVRDERTRMARDLHDALSSNLSAIAIHAEAALTTPAEPALTPPAEGQVRATDSSEATLTRERRALGAIRSASLAALEEMRTMVLLLRTGDDEVTSPAHIGDLGTLVDDARRTGLHIEFHGHSLDRDDLPAAVDHATYRIVQEALTNAVKHCPGGHARVEVAVHDSQVHVRVDSTPASAPADVTTSPSPGIGLTHMRERAEMLGGTLTAGWVDERGNTWRVQAGLPMREVAR